MTIASEVQRIKDNIANTYTALEEKGAVIPEVQNSANLADTVATVTTGGGGGSSGDTSRSNLGNLSGLTQESSCLLGEDSDQVEKDWQTVRNILDNIPLTMTCEELRNKYNFFNRTSNNNLPNKLGLVFCQVDKVEIETAIIASGFTITDLLVPDDATISKVDYDTFAVAFGPSGEKWVIGLLSRSTTAALSSNSGYAINWVFGAYANGSIYKSDLSAARVTHVCGAYIDWRNSGANSTAQSIVQLPILQCTDPRYMGYRPHYVFKAPFKLDFSSASSSTSTTGAVLSFIDALDWEERQDLAKLCLQYDEATGRLNVPNLLSANVSGTSYRKNCINAVNTWLSPRTIYLWDFSDAPSGSESTYRLSYCITNNYGIELPPSCIRLNDVYIKLPGDNLGDTVSRVTLEVTPGYVLHLTKDSMNYLAQNAPTLSKQRELFIGYVNYDEHVLSSENKALLESKNWKIRYS